MSYTVEELEKETCRSFGGNNCVLHGCMFNCQLFDAKVRALMKNGLSLEEAQKQVNSPKN